MSLILHSSKVSPPSRAVMMLIEILGLDVKFKEVSLPRREHYSVDYMKKNPLHTIPMLEDDDFAIVDSHVIMTYLVSKHSGAISDAWYPKDLKMRCLVDQRLYFDATILFPRLRNVIYSLAYGKSSGVTEEQRGDIEEGYRILEKYLENTDYIAGDSITVADLSCVATVSSLQYLVPLGGNYIKINQWWNRLKDQPWYKTKNEPGATEFGFFMSSLLRR